MEKEAEKLIEKFKNRIGKIVDEKYRDWVANDLAKFHCELMIENFKTIYSSTSNFQINHYTQLKETIKQM